MTLPSGRTSKRRDAATVLDGIPIRPGTRLGVGGYLHACRPVSLLRLALPKLAGELGVSVYATQLAGYDVDCLIAMDPVAETVRPTVTFEALGFAPSLPLIILRVPDLRGALRQESRLAEGTRA